VRDQGEEEEFLSLFLEHEDELRAFIGAVVRDRDARDDVFQEVALVLWKEFPRYDRGRPFCAWCRGIAANKLMQRWDKAKRSPVLFSPRAIQAILDAHDRAEPEALPRADALQQCLERLPDRQRQLLAYRYQNSLTLAQIAEQLHSTPDAVHKALSRLRARLRQCAEQRLTAALRRDGGSSDR
jgi:RNA polymerase sigma-70 factor (ECF subfamily)